MLIRGRAMHLGLAAALLCCAHPREVPAQRRGPRCSLQASDPAAAARLGRDVAFLADDAREGREPGTPGWEQAAGYIEQELSRLGVNPAGPEGFRQPFEVDYPAGDGGTRRVRTFNVLARIPGTAPTSRPLVVGAHLDHIGHGVRTSRSGSTEIHNGADDNASGSAVILELARRYARAPLPRDLVFAWFGAEELGLLGSAHLVANPVPATREVAAMVNFDMVGRLRDCRVYVEGRETARAFAGVIQRANAVSGFDARPWDHRRHGAWGSSDHESFAQRGVPVLFFFTGLHGEYHTERDDLATVDLPATAALVDFAERTLRELAALPEPALSR